MKSWSRALHLMKVGVTKIAKLSEKREMFTENPLSSIKVMVKQWRLELMLLIFLLAGAVSSIKVAAEQRRIEELERIRIEKETERDRLAELSIKYPDYRDLLYLLAAAEWELGNKEAAKEALARAEYLDPNNPELKDLLYVIEVSGD